MENFYDNLGVGIISGIISSLIVAFFIIIYQKIIEPYLKRLFYKNVILTGNWYYESHIEYENIIQKKREFHLHVKQSAANIKGDLNIKNFDLIEKTESWSYYKIKGEVVNNFVRINYETQDVNKIGIGHLLLEIMSGGDTLKGTIVCTELKSMKIISNNLLNFNKIK